jgi:broad specificity phosphatase PhoE
MELADMGLVEGIHYSELEGGGLTIEIDADVRLADEGRRVAEAARRRLAIEPKRVFVSYVHDDSAVVDQLCADLENAGVRTWRDIDELLPGDDWQNNHTVRQFTVGGLRHLP